MCTLLLSVIEIFIASVPTGIKPVIPHTFYQNHDRYLNHSKKFRKLSEFVFQCTSGANGGNTELALNIVVVEFSTDREHAVVSRSMDLVDTATHNVTDRVHLKNTAINKPAQVGNH